MVKSVRTASGDPVLDFRSDTKQVLDPRVAYVMTDMMEGVINNGLGFSAVRVRGFSAPAAGKTGSSHDGWFAGYTSNLLCVVWVGFDDYSDLHLSGAQTAAPIWTEFMIKATQLYPPRNSDDTYFDAPAGIEFVKIDSDTLERANESCVNTFQEAFIEGTEPTRFCTLHGLKISDVIEKGVAEPAKEVGKGVGKVFSKIFGIFGGGGDKTPKQ
jgi:penicillin-binding protein 1B